MRRVSITWHNNKDKKHIITIIKNHNKAHPLVWPRKKQLRIHPSTESKSVQKTWRARLEAYTASECLEKSRKQPRKHLNQALPGYNYLCLVLPSPKSARSPKSDILCKSYGQNSAAPPETLIAAAEDPCFLQPR